MEELLTKQFEMSFIDISAYFGLAAAGVMTLNLFVGLLLAVQYSTAANWLHRRIPLFNIHKWTGYSALFLVLLHPVWLPLTMVVDYSVLAVFFPFTREGQPILISLGALAAYTLIFVVVTAFLRQRFQFNLWKKLHYASYLVIGAFMAHAVFTEPSLKPGAETNYLDGGKIFIEACAVISLFIVAWRLSIGRKLRGAIVAKNGTSVPWRGPLKVSEIITERNDVKVFRFTSTGIGSIPFSFLPGQNLTLRINDDGRIYTRSYSISSNPEQKEYCEIAVKRAHGGRVSAFLHDRIKTGQSIECSGPYGEFTFVGTEAKSLVLIAGGIGITPLMGILRHLAAQNWPHEVYLLFSINTPKDIVFKEEIQEIAERYHYFKYLFLPTQIDRFEWDGPTGRIGVAHLSSFIPHLEHRSVYLCGPQGMMTSVAHSLHELGVTDSQIHTELFTGGKLASDDELVDTTVTFTRSKKTGTLAKGKTLLEAAEECGVTIDSLCRSGTCGTCKVKITAGTLTMYRDHALTAGDLRKHIVLACQARATSAQIQIDY